ncbi:MAG: C25 family cysteine peptidase [Blastocatellia bacterium]
MSSTSTGAAPSTGNYSFVSLPNPGSYTVTPSKVGAVTGITSFDAGRVQLDVLNPNTVLTPCQRLAGDVNQNGSLTSFDAGLIQLFVLNIPNAANHTGEWRFNPANRTYLSIIGNQVNQNYDALLLGETNGNWTPASPTSQSIALSNGSGDSSSGFVIEPPAQVSASGERSGDRVAQLTGNGPLAPTGVAVLLPTTTVLATGNFTVPILATITPPAVISFDLEFTFNPAVVGFQATPASATGLTAGWSIGSSFPNATTLKISGFGPATTGSGDLVNLNFTRVGAQGQSTALTWVKADFDDVPAFTGNGNLLLGPTAVALDGFDAAGYDNGVYLKWRTGFEAENLGFNIYREVAGKRTLVTPDIIAGSALLTGAATRLEAGQSYGWWDKSPAHQQDARYWLEELDINGTRTMHGPFDVNRTGGQPPKESQAELLSQLGRGEPRTRQLPLSYPPPRPELSALSAVSSATVTPNLASMRAVKMAIKEEGWYRVSQQELAAAGLDLKADPRRLQLYADGVEQPMLVTGDGAIEFFATGQDTVSTDARVYWVVNGDRSGKRIAVAAGDGSGGGVTSFPFTVERRDRTIYFSSLRNGETENFFGQVITSNGVDQAVAVSHLDSTSGGPAQVEIALQGAIDLDGATDHQVRVLLNGEELGRMSFDGLTRKVEKFAVGHGQLKNGDNVFTLIGEASNRDISLVDYIRVTYPRSYISDQDSLRGTASGSQTIEGFSNAAIRVFDITDPASVVEVTGTIERRGETYAVGVTLPGQGTRTLLALTNDRIKRPASISANQASKLRTKKNKASFVIIARREFFQALQPLKSLRESQGLRVALVDIEDIYDEFSDGERTPQAVKDFLSFATSTWKKKPRFVLLAGHSSLDPKNHLGFGDSDLVPTKLIDTELMETASDNWFADFDGDGLSELAVGRLPFRTANEAEIMVSKIVTYESSSASNEALFVADSNDGFDFESASAQLRGLLPSSLKSSQINRGRVDPGTVKADLIDAINRGQKIVNYIGHGSVHQWKGDLLTNDDARALTNTRLPVFVMMTCLNGYSHDAALDSLANSLLKAEHGGAVGVWASSGMTGPHEQSVINQHLYRALFGTGDIKGQKLTLGEAVMRAKASTQDSDVRRTWILLGDPTMRIK